MGFYVCGYSCCVLVLLILCVGRFGMILIMGVVRELCVGSGLLVAEIGGVYVCGGYGNGVVSGGSGCWFLFVRGCVFVNVVV